MTMREISNEMKKCQARINTLCELNENEPNSDIRMKNVKEMMKLLKRMDKLDTLNKKLILKRLKKDGKRAKKAIKHFIKMEL